MQGNYGEMHPRRHWGLGLLIGSLVVLILVAFLVAFLTHPYPATMPYNEGWWFFPFGFIFFIFFVFFIARLLFWPWAWGWRRAYWYRDDSYYILRQRYARGEITKDQYDQMMRDLEQHR